MQRECVYCPTGERSEANVTKFCSKILNIRVSTCVSRYHRVFMLRKGNSPDFFHIKQILIMSVWETQYICAVSGSVCVCVCLHTVHTLGEATTLTPSGPPSVSNVQVNQRERSLDTVV